MTLDHACRSTACVIDVLFLKLHGNTMSEVCLFASRTTLIPGASCSSTTTALPSDQEPVLWADDCLDEHLEVIAAENHIVQLDMRLVHTAKSGKTIGQAKVL